MKNRLILLLAIALGACNGEKQAPPPSVLVMVDFSQSAKDLLPDYQTFLIEISSKIPPEGRLVAGKILKTTEASFDPFIDITFPSENTLTEAEFDIRDRRDSLQRQMQRKIESSFAKPLFSPGTNIVSALSLVRQVFPNSPRPVLVLLSDMLHSSSDFDLEKGAITDKFIDDTLARLQQAGRIPDLKGVAVYVAGATAKSDERYNQIKKFWEKLFAQSGAELKSYSHTLLNFSL